MSAILLTWQLVSPLQWEREVLDTDPWTGYPTESIGRCTSDHFGAFAGSCAAFIALCLVYALRICYKTRNIPIEFSESKYIAMSIFFLFQLLILGIPILVIARENTDAYFMVMCLILFLMSFGTTLLIFVPKFVAHRRRSGRLSSLMMTAARSIAMREVVNGGTVQEIQRRVAMRASSGEELDISPTPTEEARTISMRESGSSRQIVSGGTAGETLLIGAISTEDLRSVERTEKTSNCEDNDILDPQE